MKVILQAGHAGRTSGSTGAPGEQKWTKEITPKLAKYLRSKNIEVREVGADPTDAEIAGDWDLFLAIHYDADIYNDRGGFVDTPDPTVDMASSESTRIAEEIRKTYFSKTGIPEKKERSNSNTKYYYMWQRLSAKTPCVIIEAGVGWRVQEDHNTLWFRQDDVVMGIGQGIVNALKAEEVTPPQECKEYVARIIELEKRIRELELQITEHVCPIGDPVDPTAEFVVNGRQIKYMKDGKEYIDNYAVVRHNVEKDQSGS